MQGCERVACKVVEGELFGNVGKDHAGGEDYVTGVMKQNSTDRLG